MQPITYNILRIRWWCMMMMCYYRSHTRHAWRDTASSLSVQFRKFPLIFSSWMVFNFSSSKMDCGSVQKNDAQQQVRDQTELRRKSLRIAVSVWNTKLLVVVVVHLISMEIMIFGNLTTPPMIMTAPSSLYSEQSRVLPARQSFSVETNSSSSKCVVLVVLPFETNYRSKFPTQVDKKCFKGLSS